ncbi:MAG: hypothetical protein HYY25_11075 [Candidatus Wallbacteria bacterium]|nr:hypothetical protein [Candidatus Wallbacteria bacterium]
MARSRDFRLPVLVGALMALGSVVPAGGEAPARLRKHLVPQADLGQALDWREPMEFIGVAEVEELIRKRHDREVAESRQALEEVKQSAEQLPVAVLVRSARVEALAAPGSGWCTGAVELEVDLVADGDHRVALLSGAVAVASATVDGEPALVLAGGQEPDDPNAGAQQQQFDAEQRVQQLADSLNILSQKVAAAGPGRTIEVALSGRGRHRVRAQFATRVGEEDFYRVVRFGLPGVPAAKLVVTVPGKQVSATLLPPCKLSSRADEATARTCLTADLPPAADLVLRWVEVSDAPAASAAIPEATAPTVARFAPRADATVLHRFDAGEKGVAAETTFWLRVRRAPISQLEVKLPAGVQTVSLEQPRNWSLEDPGPAGAARTARLAMPEKFTGDATVRLGLTVDSKPSGFDIELPALTMPGLARQSGYVAVSRSANLQLVCTASAGVDTASAGDLPPQVRAAIEGEELLFLFRRPDPAKSVRLRGTRYPDAAVLAAVVDGACAWTACESTGQVSGRVAYRFRSSGQEALTLDLAGHERSGLFLDGKTPAASEAAPGRVRVSLADVRPGQVSTLELRFRGAVPPLGESGRLGLRLPAIDVPVRELTWAIYTPRGYSFTSFEGVEGLRSGRGGLADWLHPPDPPWPNEPRVLRALGLAAGAHPAMSGEYLSSMLALYPLLMLFLFGGFLAHVGKAMLVDARGFGVAAAAAGIGTFLAIAYVPYYRGGAAAIIAGLTVHVLLMFGTALGRRFFPAPRQAATAAVVLALGTAGAAWAGDSAGGSLLDRLFSRSELIDKAQEAGRAQKANYLREKLLRNKQQLENERQQIAPASTPQQAAPQSEGFDAGESLDQPVAVDKGIAPASPAPSVVPEPVAAPPPPPPARPTYHIYIPYAGPAAAPDAGARGFIRKSDLDTLREEPEPLQRVPLQPRARALSAEYRLQLLTGRVAGSVAVTFEATGIGWKELAIPLQKASLTGWALDGGPGAGALVENRGSGVCLRTELSGRHRLELRFTAPATGTSQEGRLALGRTPPAPARLFVTGLDRDSELLVAGPSSETAVGREIWLEPGAPLSLGWRPKTVLALPAAASVPDDQERFSAESFTILSPSGGSVGFACRVRLTIAEAGLRTVAFKLPEGFEFLEARREGGQPAGDPAPQKDGRIVLALPERTRGVLVLELAAERSSGGEELGLEAPVFVGAERESGFVALRPEPGTDADMASERGGRGADARELPDFARPWATPALVHLRSFQRADYRFVATVRRRARLDVALLEASGAEASTLVAGTGQTLTSITYRVRNTREQFLALELPQAATLESVTVGGRPVKPAEGKTPTQKLIPLAPSRKTRQGLQTVPVTVVYSAPSGPLGRWGKWRGEVPRVSVAVQEMTWSLYLPEDYRFFRTAGDFRDAGSTADYSEGGLVRYDDESQVGPATADREEQTAQAPERAFVKKGLFGVSAPVPTTDNGKSFKVRLLKAGAAAPTLELFFARSDLGDLATGAIFYLSLLVLPLFFIGWSRKAWAGSSALAILAAALTFGSSEYLGAGTAGLVLGFTAGGAFLVLYALFKPVRWWLAPAAAVLLVSLTPLEAATPISAQRIVFPYGEKDLRRALDGLEWPGLLPAELARMASELSRERTVPESAQPPLAWSLSSGKLEADVSGDTARFALEVELDVLQPGYHAVPLLEGEVAIASFRGDGLLSVQGLDDYVNQEIVQGEVILDKLEKGREKIQVLAPRVSARALVTGLGRHQVRLEVIKVKPFVLRLPPMATCSATIRFDREGVDADIAGGLKSKVTSQDGKTILEADLASGGELRIEGYEAVGLPAGETPEPAPEPEGGEGDLMGATPAPAPSPAPPPSPRDSLSEQPYLLASVRTDLSVGEGLLKGFAVIDYEAYRARVVSLELAIPEGLRLNRIQGLHGREQPVPRLAAATGGFHSVTLAAPPGSRKSLQLTVQFEQALPDGQTAVRVPLIRTRGTKFESGFVTVQREGHVEVTASKLVNIEEVPPDRLPFATTPATSLAFRYSSGAPELEFAVVRHDEARLSTVAIDGASSRTEVAEGGGTVTHLELAVRRSSGQYLKLALPAGAQLERAMRDGAAVDISTAQDGSPLLPLDTARGPDSPPSQFLIVYRGPDVQLGFAGSFEVTLPSCELPITGRGLEWSLKVPDGYRFYARAADAGAADDFLGLWARPAPTGGRSYLSGPSGRSAIRVRYLKSFAGFALFVLHQGLFLLLGLAVVAVVYGGFPGGSGLGLLAFVSFTGALALLDASFPSHRAGVHALDLGLLAGLVLCLGWHWRKRAAHRAASAAAASTAVAAALFALAAPLQAADPTTAPVPYQYLRSQDAAALLTSGDWLFVPRRTIEETLEVLEVPKEPEAPEEPSSPEPLVAQRGRTVVKVGADDAEATATYELTALAPGIHEVSLGNPGSIVRVSVDGKPADLAADGQDGAVRVFLRGAGKHEVSVEFRVPVTRVKDAGWLQWDQPRMPICTVDVRLPGTGRGIEIVPSLATVSSEEAGETRAAATVRMAGNVFVRWFEKGEATVVQPARREAVRFESETASGFKVEGGRVTGRTELTYRVTQGALPGLTVELPAGTDLLDVTGAGVKGWKAEGPAVEIAFDRFRSGAGQLVLQHVRALPAAGALAVASPAAKGAAKHVSVIAVRADESTEFKVVSAASLRPIDPEELPPWLRAEGIPLAFRGEDGPSGVKLEVLRKKGIDTPLFDVSKMRVELVPGQGGWTAARMQLTVRNNARQHLQVLLPPGAAPLDCKVQGEPRKPGQKESELLIPLVRSTGKPAELEPFELELTYLAQDGPPPGAAARWKLPLPIVADVPVDRLELAVTVPPGRALALWSEGLDEGGRPLPSERAASAMETIAIAGNPLVWVGGVVGLLGQVNRGANVNSMLQRVSHGLDHVVGPASDGRRNLAYERQAARPSKPEYTGKKYRAQRKTARLRTTMKELGPTGGDREADALEESRSAASPAAASPVPENALAKDEALDLDGGEGDAPAELAGAAGGAAGGAASDAKADAYQALQRSLGDRGALPVGIRCEAAGGRVLTLAGALYPAGGTPSHVVLLVYDPSMRRLFDLGLGLLGFFLALLTLGWALDSAWRSPFFLVVTVLPLAAHALEWRLGDGTVTAILAGIVLGIVGAAARRAERW